MSRKQFIDRYLFHHILALVFSYDYELDRIPKLKEADIRARFFEDICKGACFDTKMRWAADDRETVWSAVMDAADRIVNKKKRGTKYNAANIAHKAMRKIFDEE